eukprot:UN06612
MLFTQHMICYTIIIIIIVYLINFECMLIISS